MAGHFYQELEAARAQFLPVLAKDSLAQKQVT